MSQPPIPPPSPGLTATTWPSSARSTSVEAVEVEVLHRRRRHRPERAVGRVLRGDQVLVRREAHVRDVDAAEQAVPVAVVRLAAMEVVDRGALARALGHRGDLRGRPQHLLVEVVDLAVLDLEVAPEAAPQPARLGTVIRDGRGGGGA